MADEAANPAANPIVIHQQELVPTGQHDTHFYDPNATDDHQLMAVYETAARAQEARQTLIESGVAPAALEIVDHTAEPVEQDGGLWGSIKRFLIPDEDAHGYAESVQRGHAVLVVRPDEARRVEVIRALEDTGPIDFDARLEEWRSAGWNGIAARQAAGGTGEVVAAPGMAPTGQAASSATTTAVGAAATVIQTRDTAATSGSTAEGMATAARPLQPGAAAAGAAATGDVYDTSTRPAAAAPASYDPTQYGAAATTGASEAGALAGGLTGGTFTGTDTSGTLGTRGAETAQTAARQRAGGTEYGRVRGYTTLRPEAGPISKD